MTRLLLVGQQCPWQHQIRSAALTERSSKLGATVMVGAITVAEVIITAGVEAVATTMAGLGAVTTVGCEKPRP